MSQQEQKSFLVKLFGGFVVAFLGFLLVVNLPAPQDVKLPSMPKATTVGVAKTFPAKQVRFADGRPFDWDEARSTVKTYSSTSSPSRTYTSSHGTSSERLGGSDNPFTQVEGFNEEDAVIYGMLKAAGYGHEEAAAATMSSAW